MPDNYYSEVNENGVVTPFRDLDAYNGVIANTKLIKDTVGWSGKNLCETIPSFTLVKGSERTKNNTIKDTPNYGTYKVSFTISNAANITKQGGIQIGDSAGNWSASADGVFDVVNGRVLLTIPFAHAVSRVYVFLNGNDGDTATATFSDFMITDADILDQSYEPYFGSTAFPRSEQAVLGAKALVYTNSTSQTLGTLVFTKNADDSVTVSPGTASETVFFNFDLMAKGDCLIKPNTQYILNGCPEGGSQNGYRLDLRRNPTDAVVESCYGDDVIFSVSNYDTITQFHYVIRIGSGTVISEPITFKPMVRAVTDPDPTYAPYAMTNRELTEKVDNIKYTSNGTSYTDLKQYVVKPTITFANGVGTATLYAPAGETIGSFAVACANSDKAVDYVNISGSTATVKLADTSYSSTVPVTIVYFTYKS